VSRLFSGGLDTLRCYASQRFFDPRQFHVELRAITY